MNVAKVRLFVERGVSRALLRLPRPILVRLAGGKRCVIDAAPLDEQVQLVLHLARITGRKRTDQLGLRGARDAIERDARVLDVAPRPMASIRDVDVRSPDGQTFPVRIYTPRPLPGAQPAPALVYLHGGGWVIGSLDSHDAICRYLADRVPCVVIAVGYRLAPEHKFPTAVDDCLAAFEWAHAHADDVRIAPDRIAVGGDSAGGNLAAVVCQERKRAGRPLPAFQVLAYPATDLSRSMASHRLFARGFFLEEPTISWFLDHYLRSPADIRDVRASCILASDDELRGLPPALVLTAGFDPLRDEGAAYAERLRRVSVDVDHRHDGGMFHGYFSCGGGIDIAKDAIDHAVGALRRALT